VRAASGYRAPRSLRVLVVDAAVGAMHVASAVDFAAQFDRGDVLVVNDAATLPASLQAGGVEIRLLGAELDGAWLAALLGSGDWHTRTEDRPAPPAVAVGDRLEIAPELSARVTWVHPESPRLVTLRFESPDFWTALYRYGRPVQYAHVPEAYALWDVQNVYAGRPWAVEMPSAGRVLTFDVLAALEARGVRVVTLTHAAGLSSVGDAAIDAMLPIPERYEIPRATWDAVNQTKGRVIAIGTSVVRALESAALNGQLAGVTSLKLAPGFERRVVDAVLTGVHETQSSHFALLGAFADRSTLDASLAEAESADLLAHEMGDACLLWARTPALLRPAPIHRDHHTPRFFREPIAAIGF
jgi:S-adenosylmethionine:tRNA ribosyltransferase-isomerase